MKLIDAEALKAEILKAPVWTGLDAIAKINTMPSIDIVRCKECRWGKPYSDKQLECDALGLGGLKFPDDYCSYGERNMR